MTSKKPKVVEPKVVEPKVVEPKKEGTIVFTSCKRGSDPQSIGSVCKSNRAYKLSTDGSPNVSFKCVECNHRWVVSIGGQFRGL